MKIIANLSVLVALLCISLVMNAQTPWTIVEKDGQKSISLQYNMFGTNVDGDDYSDTWQGNNVSICKEAVGDKYWIPQKGEQFTLTVSGTANYSGLLQVFLTDIREEVAYWASLSDDNVSMEIVEGKPFSIQHTFTISKVETDEWSYSGAGIFLSEPSVVIMAIPSITSKFTDFDNKRTITFELTEFDYKYIQAESEKYFEITYNEKGFDRDSDKISDDWQTAFPMELATALNEYGVSSWEPQVGETFTIKMKGVANYTGNLGIYIVDQNVDPKYWTYLSTTDEMFPVTQGKVFSLEKTFVITVDEKYGMSLKDATLVLGCMPSVTSSQAGFDAERTFKLNLSNYSIQYAPAPEFAKVFATEYVASGEDLDGDGISDKWQSTFSEEIPLALQQAEKTDWQPKADEKITIKMKGFANFSGSFDFYLADQRDEVGKWALLCDSTEAISVIAGELFEIEKEIIITNTEKNGILLNKPELVLRCFSAIQSTSPGFDNTTKHSLYLNDYSIKYDSVYVVVKTFETENYMYASNTWQSYFRSELTDAVGYTLWQPQKGETFALHLKGLANFSGTVNLILADIREEVGYWGGLCENPNAISFTVTKGELFDITDTFLINVIQKDGVYLSTPEFVIQCIPDDTKIDKKQNLILSLGEYSCVYANPAIVKTFEVFYDETESDYNVDGVSDVWRTSFSDELPLALNIEEIADWEPKVGDTFTLKMRGTANYSGKLNFLISEQTAGTNYKVSLCEVDQPISVSVGRVCEIERTLLVTSVERNSEKFVAPSLAIVCEPSAQSGSIDFNVEEKMVLSLTEYSLTYKEAPEFTKVFRTEYDESSSDRDSDGISDTWRSAFDDEVASALSVYGISEYIPESGETFSVYAKGISNFTGLVKLFVGDFDESGKVVNACKEEHVISVIAGKEINEDLTFTLQGSDIVNPKLIIVCEPTATSKNAYFDSQAEKSLYLTDYSIVYLPNYDFVKVFEVDYNRYASDVDNDGVSDFWMTAYDDELDASWEQFDITDFKPAIGEEFTIKVKGVSSFTGDVAFSIIDDSPEIGYWGILCDDQPVLSLRKGEIFEFEQKLIITKDQIRDVPVKQAKLLVSCLPKITSTNGSFNSDKQQKLYLMEYSVEYSGPKPRIQLIRDRKLVLNGKTLELNLATYCASLDGAKLTFDVVAENPDLVTISIEDGILRIKPGSEEGTTAIELNVVSSNGKSASRTFNVTVAQMKEIQILAYLDDIEIEMGNKNPHIDLSQYFTIAEGVTLLFDATSSNSSAVAVSVEKQILTLQAIGEGVAEIVVYVESSEGALEEQRFQVTVLPKATAVDDQMENAICVYAISHTIYVKNANQKVTLFDSNGRTIASDSSVLRTPLLFNVRLAGVYYVTIGQKTYSVIVE